MVLKTISPGYRVRASLMLIFTYVKIEINEIIIFVLLLMGLPRSTYLRIFINFTQRKTKLMSCDLLFSIFMRWNTITVTVMLEV